MAKQPGQEMLISPVQMRFSYQESFQTQSPDAYETLIADVVVGDQTLFMREDQIQAAWTFLMPILDVWENHPPTNFANYPAGSWGPEEAETLIARDGRT